MRNEKAAIKDMSRTPGIRRDLFSMKQAVKSTGLSRAMLLKLENAGFLIPKEINKKTGYRYYDTFNIHKLLEYKRLRFSGLSQAEIFSYYDAKDNSEMTGVLDTMRRRERLIQRDIELLSLRLEKDKRNYSFSYYDFDKTLCLTCEGDFIKPSDILTTAYNQSVEIVSRGLMASVTQNIFTIRYDTEQASSPYHAKICSPIGPDVPTGTDMTDIEWIPGCHTYSMLFYGAEGYDEARTLLWDKVREAGHTPIGNELRSESIVAPYVNMHVSPEDFVTRFSIPIETE